MLRRVDKEAAKSNQKLKHVMSYEGHDVERLQLFQNTSMKHSFATRCRAQCIRESVSNDWVEGGVFLDVIFAQRPDSVPLVEADLPSGMFMVALSVPRLRRYIFTLNETSVRNRLPLHAQTT